MYEGTFPIKQCVKAKGINRDARYIEEDQYTVMWDIGRGQGYN